MAEVLGAVAAVVGLLEAGGRISTKLRTLRQSWRNAPLQLMALQNEITDFEAILLFARDACNAARDLSEDRLAQSLEQHLASAEACLSALEGLVEEASKYNGSKLKRWWVRRKAIVNTRRDSLREVHRYMWKLLDAFNGQHGYRIKLELTAFRSEMASANVRNSESFDLMYGLIRQGVSQLERICEQNASYETIIAKALQQREETTSARAEGETLVVDKPSRNLRKDPANMDVWASYRNGSCVDTCECSCHLTNIHHSLWHTSRFLRSFIGFLFASYIGLPSWTPPCNTRRCLRLESKTYSLRYEFPRWLVGLFVYILIHKEQQISLPRISVTFGRRVPFVTESFLGDLYLGNFNRARQILLDNPSALFDTMEDGTTALQLFGSKIRKPSISYESYSELLKVIVGIGPDFQKVDDSGISGGDSIACNFLLKVYAREQSIALSQLLPIQSLIDNLDLSVVSKIILGIQAGDLRTALANKPSSDAMLDEPDSSGFHPLQWAILVRHTEAIKILLEHGANINAPGAEGKTPVMTLLYTNLPLGVFRAFIRKGADIRKTDDTGINAFHHACWLGNVEAARIMVEEHCADPNEPISKHDRESPLHLAIRNDGVETASYLIDAGASPRVMNASGRMPVHEAVMFNATKCLQLLLDNSTSYRAQSDACDMLYLAALYGEVEVMEILAKHGLPGADIHALFDGRTAEDLFRSRRYRSKELDNAFYNLLEAVERATSELRRPMSLDADEEGSSAGDSAWSTTEDGGSDEDEQTFQKDAQETI